jgi:hypothetical protein
MLFYDTKKSHFLSSYSQSINMAYMKNSEFGATLKPCNFVGFRGGCFLSDNFFCVFTQSIVLRLFSCFWEATASTLSGLEDVIPKRRNMHSTLTLQNPKRRLIYELFGLWSYSDAWNSIFEKNLEHFRIMYCDEFEITLWWRCEHILFIFRVYVEDWRTVKETHTCSLVRM